MANGPRGQRSANGLDAAARARLSSLGARWEAWESSEKEATGAQERETAAAGAKRTREVEEARQMEAKRQNPNSPHWKSPGANQRREIR